MKVKKLIELLLKENPNDEVKLWNGFVGDVVDINTTFTKHDLIKPNIEYTKMALMYDLATDKKTFVITDEEKEKIEIDAKKVKHGWELNQGQYQEKYIGRKKRVCVIDAKVMNKTSFDRVGRIHY